MLKAGTVVGEKYRLRHLIAEGGMAEVYLAESVILSQASCLYAIKRLRPELAANNPVFVDMFFHEAALAQSLHHKNVVTCYEFFRDGNDSYIVMEFVLGKEVGALFATVKDLPLLERTKIMFLVGIGVCDALVYLHEQKSHTGCVRPIVHGDISPQNIMVSVDGTVKLYDFGAAKGFSDVIFEEELVRGNLRYMSPEQLLGAPMDTKSDVFSLALVLLELLCGESLVVERSERSLNNGAAWDPLLSVPSDMFLSKAVHTFFTTALALEKERRFASCRLMREQLLLMAADFIDSDPQKSLSLMLGSLSSSTVTSYKRRVQHETRYGMLVGVSAVSLSVFVWAIVAVFSDVFEPKTQHNVPYWPKQEPLKELEQKTSAPESEPARTFVSSQPKVSKPNLGTLSLKVKPWAEVFIDGKFFGATPMAGLTLPEGEYLVQLRNPHVSAVALRMVKIYANKKTELIHNF